MSDAELLAIFELPAKATFTVLDPAGNVETVKVAFPKLSRSKYRGPRNKGHRASGYDRRRGDPGDECDRVSLGRWVW